MTPHGDGRHVMLLLPPREQRTHVVDRHAAAERLRLCTKPVAYLPVEVGEREPANTAFRRGADRGGLHQAAPQAFGVDLQVAHGAATSPPSPLLIMDTQRFPP